MQTFIVYRDFEKTARVLDRQRLGKQRVECLQILRALTGITKGWANHPATKAWSKSRGLLIDYSTAICAEWKARGYVDNCLKQITEIAYNNNMFPGEFNDSWITPEFCISHQSNLIRKFPEHYRKYFGYVLTSNLPYIWPSKLGV